jgi:hypothetical protein
MPTARWETRRTGVHGRTIIHVLPIADLKPHDISSACWCHPSVRQEGLGFIVSHTAEDGRELVEEHGLQ